MLEVVIRKFNYGVMKLKTTIEIKLKPFKTPNFVLVEEEVKPREEGFNEGRKFSLSELDADTLSRMCNDFRAEIFKKAGKCEPPTAV